MTEDILDIFPGINERLGHIYHRSEEYLQSIEHENELEEKMREVLDRKQISVVDSYLDAVGVTSDIAALIAYRQGMQDLIRVLMGGD